MMDSKLSVRFHEITKIKQQQCKHWVNFVLKGKVKMIFIIHAAEKLKKQCTQVS